MNIDNYINNYCDRLLAEDTDYERSMMRILLEASDEIHFLEAELDHYKYWNNKLTKENELLMEFIDSQDLPKKALIEFYKKKLRIDEYVFPAPKPKDNLVLFPKKAEGFVDATIKDFQEVQKDLGVPPTSRKPMPTEIETI